MIDYYEVLQVSPDASEETIDEQYRFLLQAFEADPFEDDEERLKAAAAETALLKEAYRAVRGAVARPEAGPVVVARRETTGELVAPQPKPEVYSAPSLVPATSNEVAVRRRSLDPRVVAAFLTGAVLAVGILALKYRHAGSRYEASSGAGLSITHSAPAERNLVAANGQSPGGFARAHPSAAAPMPGRIVSPAKLSSSRAAMHQRPALANDQDERIEGPTGSGRAERPVTVDIIPAKGGQTAGTAQVGNVEVVYADGVQETWTTRGNCGQAHIAADGTVGWTVYRADKPGIIGNFDFQPNGTLVLCRRGQIVARINSSLPYIDSWNFLDRGGKVVLRTRGLTGAPRIDRRESATGLLLDSVPAETADLPEWALPLADR